jgi:2-dehydro-3-deoxygalactonokinase
MSISVDWIAVDWGTSCLRVWAMGDGKIVAHARSDQGMAGLSREEFEGALMQLIEPWLSGVGTPVIACGMVGARQGWVEAPYNTVPCAALPGAPVRVPDTDPRIAAYVVPGLRQLEQADVMRGEETQIAGFLSMNPGWDGVICLPGTHTKWAHVSAEEVVSFRTFMTGELFDLLGSQSVLRHSIGDGWDKAAFMDAVQDMLSRPENLAARLFGLRAHDLLESVPGGVTRSRLSGYLVGAELAASRPYWLGQNLAIIGNSQMAQNYGLALQAQGAVPTIFDADDLVRAGLATALVKLGETV